MPFKSEAQRRYFHWAAEHGKDGITKEMAHEWEHATPKSVKKKLPYHVEKKAMDATQEGFLDELLKIAAAKEEGFSAKSLIAPAAGLAAGVGAYGLFRKFRPSAIPELRALQQKAKDKVFQVATSRPEGRGLRSMLFGARDIPASAAHAGKTEGGVARAAEFVSDRPNSVVLHHNPGGSQVAGGVNINQGVLPEALDDKYVFHQLMTQGTGGGAGMPGSVPETALLRDSLRAAGGDVEKMKKMIGKDYVIKPRSGSMSKAEQLLTNATDTNDPRLQKALRSPAEYILQEKIPIQNEFRVHMVNNVPVHSTHRQLPNEKLREVWNKHMGGGGGAFMPVMGDERQKLEAFARQATEHLGRTGEGTHALGEAENLHHALDIARLHDGSYKLIESNPTPGTLMNPIISRKVQQAVTGRLPRDVAALGAVGAGGGTAIAANSAVNAYDNRAKKER